MTNQANSPEDVLDFWFSARDETGAPVFREAWFVKDPDFDAEIRRRFGALHDAAMAGDLDGWQDAPEGALALVVILDQFSRNMFRDDPRMYDSDERARDIAGRALAAGYAERLPVVLRWFLFLPFMHSEALEDQETCLRLIDGLPDGASVAEGRKAAQQHRDIVARFGRFPHRNRILGRATTPEEEEFLKEPDSSF